MESSSNELNARGNLTILREQLLRLAGSMITVKSDDGIHARGRNTQLMEEWDLVPVLPRARG